ncbi:MAG: 4-hydroxythreonine-4-phosphate dehydrogenase PdxA [Methyloligellaceae bacterium]
MHTQQNTLALTMGDPSGIGIEIALKAWLQRFDQHIPTFCLLAEPQAVARYAAILDLKVPFQVVSHFHDAPSAFEKHLPVLEISLEDDIEPGNPRPEAASAIISSIQKAVELTIAGAASAVVTNPIAKSVLYKAGFIHPGHTEFLGELAGNISGTAPYPVMMLASEQLRTVPVTVHIPLEEVAKTLKFEGITRTVSTVCHDLKQYFNIKEPRIAVTGLNPHAGESGALGQEEIDIIIPAVKYLQSEGLNVKGPYPADTIFHSEARKTYDVVVAMYHDQALIPLKTLSFDEGVNVTLGLPFIRTSPDHGTAFDIAGKGLANPLSLIHALKLASRMAENSRKTDPK